MNPDDPVITRVSATNPVPDPGALTDEQLAAARTMRSAIASASAPPARRPRRMWPGALAVASIVPVVIVAIVVLGVHHRPGAGPGRGDGNALRLPSSGAAQNLLLIGSDHRAGEPWRDANTDTMMLVRLDPGAPTVNVLSVPRDLEVRIPAEGGGVTAKLNSAYSIGGVSLLLSILRTQVFPGLEVNHVIDFNFQGFIDLVDALGCVYGDVDHRYYNDTSQTRYSSIDLEPGYQRLCGLAALQFVRFRHTDSDLVRQARQQAFLGWLRDGVSLGTLFNERDRLFTILGRYAETDIGLRSTDGLIQLFDLALNVAGHPLARIPFPVSLAPCSTGTGATCYLTAARRDEAAAYARFLGTGAAAASPSSRSAASPASPVSPASPGTVHAGPASVIPDAAGGQAQATALGSSGVPVYYPAVIAGGSSYCSTAGGSCREGPNPASRYTGAYPRAYPIQAGGRRYPSYRMTLVLNAALGEYYGVEGTTWPDPPLLRHPAQTEVIDGRRLREYGTGSALTLVAFSTGSATYWVSNTLTDSIPATELVAIAASMRPAQ